MDFADRHPEIKVVIKTKAAGYYLQYAKNIYEQNFTEKINNLIITDSADPFQLVAESMAVIS